MKKINQENKIKKIFLKNKPVCFSPAPKASRRHLINENKRLRKREKTSLREQGLQG